jgi:hypothetical protein
MKKKTDAQLFKELRINVIIIGLAMIIIFVVGIFMIDLGDYWYRFVLLIGGLLLLSYAFQKYLQEHPKVRIALMCILIILALLGVIVFFMFTRSVG